MRQRAAAGLVLLLAAASAPVAAHHSATATYAADQALAVKGRVVGFAWTNPHCLVYLDVTHGPFAGQTYTVELGSPSALAGDGWTKTMLRAGDTVVMTVHPSRAGTPSGLCRRCAMTINGASWRGSATVE